MGSKTGMVTGAVAVGLILCASAVQAEDGRELVALPPMMQEHMLGNMRDHLAALNEILGALERGEDAQGAKVAEMRLGMSSMASHGASHMAPFMPAGMRELGTAMHRAASRFSQVVQDAGVEGGDQGARMVYGALREITDACHGCHLSYRIR